MKNKTIKKMCIGVALIAIGYVLPFITGGIKEIGNMLCPMHLPTLVSGIILGPLFGGLIGFIIPLLRSFTLGMPVLFPQGLTMAFELFAYGFFSGIFVKIFKNKFNFMTTIYISLILSMILGRVIWGIANIFFVAFDSSAFTFKMFISGAFLYAWPGIIIQLVLIPPLIYALKKTNLLEVFDEWK